MFVDQWQSGPVTENFPVLELESVPAEDVTLLARMDAYLASLPFDDAQRLWLRAELALQLRQLDRIDPAQRSARLFATLQNRIATLHRGDEWEARLALTLRSVLPVEIDQPSRWLRGHQLAVQRRSMASLPMQRSFLAFLQRQAHSLRQFWNQRRRLVPFWGSAQ
ncbi:hypothetical protein [Candidatus Igneacidithiobacillus taiwanensis]|uniref:hypothetical protein n=1 Tax=Candidatus Igneacidithiobacillus taiwanensis TaxID=1945924 RepID=UPI00289AB398|nr:hypothetical protein [Candidatus Igneacidithiobacillus taiwanensis]MCE5360864.1 hypothetical protein [Acidithiobacillus sp.]